MPDRSFSLAPKQHSDQNSENPLSVEGVGKGKASKGQVLLIYDNSSHTKALLFTRKMRDNSATTE